MKILGMVGSFRKNGNSDIVAKEALMGAQEAGAQVELLHLTDYKIEACQGFGLCLFRKEGCHIKDDVKVIWSKIEEADGILLSVPCYFLESTAVLKQLIDRAWVLAHRGTFRGKYASVMVPYATRAPCSLPRVRPARSSRRSEGHCIQDRMERFSSPCRQKTDKSPARSENQSVSNHVVCECS